MLISLFGNIYQEQSLTAINELIAFMIDSGLTVEIESDFHNWLTARGASHATRCPAATSPSPASDAIISVGGDGTLLKAAHWAAKSGIPVTGINTGHLGFLTSWQMHDAPSLVNAITHNSLNIELRSMLCIECDALPHTTRRYALNDVALLKEKSGSMITVRTFVDDSYLTDYEADGLLICTPSGSTAYNLSAGGPIMQPTVPALSLTPIAPHTLTMRPLVVSDSCRLTTLTDSRTGSFMLSIDGATISLPAGSRVEIFKAPFNLRLAGRPGNTFADPLREKLLWGTSLTNRQHNGR